MRSILRGVLGIAVVGMMTLTPTASNAQRAERELLGIRIWRDWRTVLAKHGPPTRIEIGAVTTELPAQGGGAAASRAGAPSMGGMMPGMMPGGLPGTGAGRVGPMGMSPMMGGGTSPMGAMMGGGMTAPMGGGGMMGPSPGMMSGMLSGLAGRAGGAVGPMPGMGAMPGIGGGSSAMSGMMGVPGMGNAGGTRGGVETSENEVTWIYERGPNRYLFLFNKDGRVIQIQSFGYKAGGSTARGIKLGAPLSQVYRTYGWPGGVTKTSNSLVLDYSDKAHVAFQLLDQGKAKGYQVVGITVAQTEGRRPASLFAAPIGGGMQPGGTGTGMPGMMPGGLPGLPGMGPGTMPGMGPGMMPGMGPGMMPGMMPGSSGPTRKMMRMAE